MSRGTHQAPLSHCLTRTLLASGLAKPAHITTTQKPSDAPSASPPAEKSHPPCQETHLAHPVTPPSPCHLLAQTHWGPSTQPTEPMQSGPWQIRTSSGLQTSSALSTSQSQEHITRSTPTNPLQKLVKSSHTTPIFPPHATSRSASGTACSALMRTTPGQCPVCYVARRKEEPVQTSCS